MALLPLLALAATAAGTPPPAAERTQLLAALVAECRLAEAPASDIQIVDYAGRLARGPDPDKFCRSHDKVLALKLARMIAEAPSPASGGAYALLAAFHRGAQGMKPDSGLARVYGRRAWLLGSRLRSPFKSPEEQRAYLTDPDSIAFLRDRLARGSPPRERIWLAEALLARRSGGDVEEVRTLLRSPEASRQLAAPLTLAELALEPGATAADVADAAMRLRSVAASSSAGSQARPLLFRLARLQLAAARSPDDKWEAVRSFAAAAYAGDAEFLAEFRAALLAANGGSEPATVDAIAPRPPIRPDDFPAWAMQDKLAGVVRLRALVDPLGRIVFTEPAAPEQPPELVGIVRRIYATRSLPPLVLPKRPTPYVWVAIRPITFRIVD